jgi:hypothetical protein
MLFCLENSVFSVACGVAEVYVRIVEIAAYETRGANLLGCSLLIIIHQYLHPEVWDSSYQAAHYEYIHLDVRLELGLLVTTWLVTQ